MPIEDIDFLKANSKKENYVFMVDSRDRDKIAYPNPSEYIVEFTTPFKQVIGLNLIDASIPRTMYNIDIYNNELKFFIHSSNYDLNSLSLDQFQTAILEPGDYTIQTLQNELTNKLIMNLNNNSNLPEITITATPLSNPPDVKNRLSFSCPYPFIFNMKDSSIAESLGFDAYVRISEYNKSEIERNYDPYILNNYYGITDSNVISCFELFKLQKSVNEVTNYLISNSNTTYITDYNEANSLASRIEPYSINYQLFHSVDIPFNELITLDSAEVAKNTFSLFEGPRGVIRVEPMNSKLIAQRFYVESKTNLTKIYAALQTDTLSPSSIVQFSIQQDDNNKPNGVELETGSIAVSFIDGSLSDSTDLSLSLQENTYYWIVFNSNETIKMYYNDVLTTTTPFKYSNDNGVNWNSYDDNINDIYYQLSLRIDVCNDYHEIQAPGMYSLVGERYIIIRCPEIEENSYRSLSYSKYNLGIAKIKLGVVGYSDERFDYSNIPTREFHPIGKLSRITIRFETSSGRLYDFKDVNHTITFNIKYYEPQSNTKFTRSIINSNYDGDFMKYQYLQEEQEEDSDDQDIDYNKDDFDKYKINEARNLPKMVAQRNIQMFYDLNYEDDEEDEEDEYDNNE